MNSHHASRSSLSMLCGLALAACSGSSSDGAFAADTTKTITGETEFSHQFSGVRKVIELPDGRLLVHDSKEAGLLLADMSTGAVTPVGRAGAGPLEYRLGGQLFTAGDTIVFYDASLRRLLYISPQGKPTRTVPFTPNDTLWTGSVPEPTAVDTEGRLYGQTLFRQAIKAESDLPVNQLPAVADTSAIRRLDLRTGQVETLARVQNPVARFNPKVELTGSVLRITITGLDYHPFDVWTAMPDGRLAVIRDGVYQVHFIGGAQPSDGPVIDFVPIPITTEERHATEDSMVAEAKKGFETAGPDSGALDIGVIEPKNASKTKPPYEELRVSPSGLLWVQTPTAGYKGPERYDVLDEKGARIWSTMLPKGEKLVALGRKHLYTLRQDDVDFLYIRRYPLPSKVAR